MFFILRDEGFPRIGKRGARFLNSLFVPLRRGEQHRTVSGVCGARALGHERPMRIRMAFLAIRAGGQFEPRRSSV